MDRWIDRRAGSRCKPFFGTIDNRRSSVGQFLSRPVVAIVNYTNEGWQSTCSRFWAVACGLTRTKCVCVCVCVWQLVGIAHGEADACDR